MREAAKSAVSRLNPDIVYYESRTIDDEDVGHKSAVFELDIGPSTYSVVLGKPKYTYSSKNVVFFPIYAVSKRAIRAQIGVFEFESSKLLNVYKKGDLDLARFSPPVLYSFAVPEYLAKTNADPRLFSQLTPTPVAKASEIQPILENEIAEDNPFELHVQTKELSTAKEDARRSLRAGIFSQDTRVSQDQVDDSAPEEETQETADAAKTAYVESLRNTWIEQFMKNNHYRLHENEGGGDCLFAVVRDAFAQIGKNTTVEKMRSILADEMTDDVFQEHRAVYLGFADEIDAYDRDLTQIDRTLGDYKSRVKSTGDNSAADSRKLIEDSKILSEKRASVRAARQETEKLQKDYVGYMKTVDTLEAMRQYVRTSHFWADTWAISTLERVLNVKMIILSERAFGEGDIPGVLNCGEINKDLQEKQQFAPDYYILTAYTGDHYRLVSYHNRRIFKFKEIPYDLKILVLNKCLEQNSGAFYLIQDFRNLKSKFGIDEDAGHPDDYEDLPGAGELFDPAVVFVFYAKSDKSVRPGAGGGEKMPKGVASDYSALSAKAQLDWRKKLDDEWDKSPFMLDGKKWATVEHYLLGARFRKGHPDMYHLFSLDSAAAGDLPAAAKNLATDVKKARAFKAAKAATQDVDQAAAQAADQAAAQAAVKKPAPPKMKPVAPDMDFDRDEEREKALRAKFLDNVDMNITLRLTKKALLVHKEKSGTKGEPDMALMRVRATA